MVWDSKIKFVSSCGKINQNFMVYFDQIVYNKIKYLMKMFDRLEWLGYLIGDIDYEANKAYVRDFIIPKQTVSGVTVNNIVSPIGKQYIGVIHSHHHMMNSFSGTDHEFINQNNDISILVTHKEINGQIRLKTECGCYYIIPVDIEPNIDNLVDNDFISSVKSNIEIEGINIQSVIKKDFDLRSLYRDKIDEYKSGFKVVNDYKLWDDVFDEDDEDEDDDFDGNDKSYLMKNGMKIMGNKRLNRDVFFEEEEEEEEKVSKKIWHC